MAVQELWRHPVKSMQGEQVDTVKVVGDGVAGDRAWGVIDTQTGKVLTGRREPRLLLASARIDDSGAGGRGAPVITLPGGTTIEGVGAHADAALSAWLDAAVRLLAAEDSPPAPADMFADATDDTSAVLSWMMPAGRYVDVFPLLLMTTASLRAGAAHYPAGNWHPRRFRPNVLIDVPGDDWLEDGWQGRVVGVGRDTRLTVARPASRCTMITRPQPGLARDLDMFRTLAKQHGATFGMWAGVKSPGTVRVGDTVRVG